MDNAQIEQELEDLESRMERLRALYEQYFLGLEKLEPTVLRKDVDRKLWVMRREQIRNTGLRFKFQMLIQRYNTYQQYWTRVVREIESGTYRRDIIKVAQRFGEKDAMTILGKKRAEQYKRLAINQLDRRSKLRGDADGAEDGAARDRPSVEISVAEEEAPYSLSPSDLEMIEDDDRDDHDAPTPPRGLPPVRMHAEPDMESLLMAATVGVTTWRDPPQAPAPSTTAAPAPAPITIDRPASDPRSTSAIAAPATSAAVKPIAAPAPREPIAPAAEAPATDTAVKVAAPPQAKAPATAPTTSPAKSRVAELAAQMRAKKEAAKPKNDDLDLDRILDAGVDAPKPKAPAAPATSKPTSAAAPPAAEKTPVSPPRFAPSPQPVKAAPPPPATKPSAQPPAAKTAPLPPATKPSAQPSAAKLPSAPEPPAARPAPSASRNEDLSEQKMREIYAKYVGAKRAANESTAGITYDKLAASLRAQADKIKTSHPARSIDFEVVTKDGKTALRPVVK